MKEKQEKQEEQEKKEEQEKPLALRPPAFSPVPLIHVVAAVDVDGHAIDEYNYVVASICPMLIYILR